MKIKFATETSTTVARSSMGPLPSSFSISPCSLTHIGTVLVKFKFFNFSLELGPSFSTAAISYVKWNTLYDAHDDLWVTDADVVFDITGQDEIKGVMTVQLGDLDPVIQNATLQTSAETPGEATFNFRDPSLMTSTTFLNF